MPSLPVVHHIAISNVSPMAEFTWSLGLTEIRMTDSQQKAISANSAVRYYYK